MYVLLFTYQGNEVMDWDVIEKDLKFFFNQLGSPEMIAPDERKAAAMPSLLVTNEEHNVIGNDDEDQFQWSFEEEHPGLSGCFVVKS